MSPESLPEARVERIQGAGWARLLPIAALVGALLLLRGAWSERGPRIVVSAAEGHGLAPGDRLRFRGIEVGKVEAVELAEDAAGIRVRVRLARSAADLARAGARFWIARPVLGVEGVSGLETALGERYLAVLPGPSDSGRGSERTSERTSERQHEFVALDEPPLFEREDPASLEVLLHAGERGGLARGAPLLYRGIPVGTVVSVGLARDATAVEFRASIRAEYAELVRDDTRFYRVQAAELSLGLRGIELALDSLQSLWLGGVALATPTHPGPRARSGQRFALAREPEDAWLEWRPALALEGAWPTGESGEARIPERAWGRLTWEPKGWFSRRRSLGGWLVRDGDALLGPADVLVAPDDSELGGAALELLGESLSLESAPGWAQDGLARRTLTTGSASFRGEKRTLVAPEDLLVCADPALAPMAVAAEHLAAEGGSWTLSASLPLDERWHGGVVLARADGAWVGVLLVREGVARIAALPQDESASAAPPARDG